MALATNALTNVATMESILGIASGAEDAKLQRVINQASAIAETYTNRVFYRNTAITEKHPGQAGPLLLLKQPYINSITSITYLSGSAEGSTSYEIQDASVGSVYRVSGSWAGIDYHYGDTSQTVFTGQGRAVWAVVYDGGWYTPKQEDDDGANVRTLPYDLEQAVIAISVFLYRAEARDPTLKSESLMEASQSYATISMGTVAAGGAGWLEQAVPGAAAILKRYRRGVFA